MHTEYTIKDNTIIIMDENGKKEERKLNGGNIKKALEIENLIEKSESEMVQLDNLIQKNINEIKNIKKIKKLYFYLLLAIPALFFCMGGLLENITSLSTFINNGINSGLFALSITLPINIIIHADIISIISKKKKHINNLKKSIIACGNEIIKYYDELLIAKTSETTYNSNKPTLLDTTLYNQTLNPEIENAYGSSYGQKTKFLKLK